MFRSVFNVASSAMSANRLRLNTIASNIANAQTTKTAEGGPYKRRDVVFVAQDLNAPDTFGSALDRATVKSVGAAVYTPPQKEVKVYDPSHPDADPQTGMVALPDINPVTEMGNMVMASTAYKAAAEVVSATKDIAQSLRRLAQRL